MCVCVKSVERNNFIDAIGAQPATTLAGLELPASERVTVRKSEGESERVRHP